MSKKTREIDAGQYSSLSNNSIEWNNSVGWKISPNSIILQMGFFFSKINLQHSIRFCGLNFFKKK
jgi:hypothetical protein